MSTFLIGFDLNREGANYSTKHAELIELIKKEANGYWRNLDSTWIINSDKDPETLRNRFLPVLDDNDELLVITVGAPAAWCGFDKSSSDWLIKYLK